MGRPKGVKDTKPRKPRSDRKVKPEQIATSATPETVEAVETPEIIETKPATPETENLAKHDERITEDFQFILDSYEDAASESETIEEEETGFTPEPNEPDPEPSQDRPKIRMSGAMFLALIDSVLPRGVVAVGRMFDKRADNFSYRDIKMSKEEKEDHIEMADQIAKMYLDGINPIVFFVASIGMIYGSNFNDMLSKQPKPIKAIKRRAKMPELKIKGGKILNTEENDTN